MRTQTEATDEFISLIFLLFAITGFVNVVVGGIASLFDGGYWTLTLIGLGMWILAIIVNAIRIAFRHSHPNR